jgi:hypothetical protein
MHRFPVLRPFSLLAGFLAVLAPGALAQAPRPKQVAAPASDILAGVVRLPEPHEAPVSSRAAMLPVELAWQEEGGWAFEGVLPLERAGPLSIALLSPEASRWRVVVTPPGGAPMPLAAPVGVGAVERRSQVLDGELSGWVVDRHDLERAAPGLWSLRVEVPGAPRDLRPWGGWILAAGESALRIEAWTSTALLLADERVGVNARLAGGEEPVAVERGQAWVEVGGRTLRLELADDGEHADGAAGDGVWGALLPHGTSGRVRARVELAGRLEAGGPFLRTTQLAFGVLERRLALTGAASARVDDERHLRIDLEAWPLGPAAGLHVSAEVWGTGADGRLVPVCWLSRMDAPQPRGEAWDLPLWLDGRWLDVAGARPPLELRQVRVQDPDTHVPFDLLERLPLEVRALPAVVGRGQVAVTREMLMGPLPSTLAGATSVGPAAVATPQPNAPGLMLVHGYCSGGNIWPPADFTQPKVVFLDPDENRTHDEFARLLDQRARSAGLLSFGVVAHSQGGAAALHLYTYFQSGLDLATGPRLIQSVATPYQGTPLASLGSFACGVNDDMTPNGAANWLAGIPSWARAEVFYWTTSNSGSACNFLTGILLSDPEDGTIEQFRGQLPGASNMGHVVGWCHTTGMSDPASYTDHARNQAMDAAAAR